LVDFSKCHDDDYSIRKPFRHHFRLPAGRVSGCSQTEPGQTATFLGIKPSRLEWAGKGGIIKRDKEGFYPCETVKAQWFGLRARLTRQGKKAQPI